MILMCAFWLRFPFISILRIHAETCFALLIYQWLVTALQVTLCMQHGLTAADLAGTMHPYPTSAEVVRQAAQAFVRSQCLGPGTPNDDRAIQSF